MLSLETILSPDALKPHKVSVPEWGGDVYVAALTAEQRDELEEGWGEYRKSRGNEKSQRGIRGYFVAAMLCNERGERLFENGKRGEAADVISAKAAGPVNRIFTAGCNLNCLTKDDVEELEKNSVAAPAPPNTAGS